MYYPPRDPITGRYDDSGLHYSYYDSSRPPSPRSGYTQPYHDVYSTNHYPQHDSMHRAGRYSRPVIHQNPPASNRVNPEPVQSHVYRDSHPTRPDIDHPPRSDQLTDKLPSYHSDAPSYGKTTYDSSASMRQKHQYWNSQKIHKTSGNADPYSGGRYAGGGIDSARCRKCVAVICGILAVLLLIGTILGLYFGIKEALKQQEQNAPENNVRGDYSGGYYVNGVYVVPVTSRPGYTYLIYGTEVPCNPYNNNSVTMPNYPDCDKVTTKIVWVNWTTTTPRTVYVSAGSAAVISLSPIISLAVSIICTSFHM